MRKISLVVILLAGCLTASFAQTTTDNSATDTKNEKLFDHYVSVQLNELIRQVFNFNNTSTPNTNPYLLNYTISLHNTGWGLRVGAGYVYTANSSDDGITVTDTKMNDLSLRIGIEKAFQLSKKWSTGAGLDFIHNSNNDHTSTVVNSSFGGNTTDTKTTTINSGAGPMAWLRYAITEKILIGTEASFYYLSGKTDQTVTITDPSGFPTTTPTSTKTGSGSFSSPIVFFLGVKF